MINLNDMFGKDYRVRDENGKKVNRYTDPWLMVVLCQHGHVYPHGRDGWLGAATDKRGGVAQKLRQLPYVQVVQDGNDGINCIFPQEKVQEILELLRVRRRNKGGTFTEEQILASQERLRRYLSEKGPRTRLECDAMDR